MFPQRAAWTSVIERGIETRSDAIQIFNQSPRMWRPTRYTDEDCAAFRAAMDGSRVKEVAVHAVYLIHTPSADREVRTKSLASLTHSLRLGDEIGAIGVVLHAGSGKDAPMATALKRSGEDDRGGARVHRLLPAAAREHGRLQGQSRA